MWFYTWGLSAQAPWDPEKRLAEPIALTRDMVASFAAFLRVSNHQHRVLVLPGGRGRHQGVLSSDTVKQYLHYVWEFVKWAFETQSKPLISDYEKDNMARLFADELDALAPHSPPPPQPLSSDDQAALLAVCHPQSSRNPFNRQVRFRNYAMIYALITTGIRKGEISKLRLEDLNLSGTLNTISVTLQDEETESEKHDTRSVKPRQKTKGRKIPITDALKEALVAYLRNERSKRATSPFLFLSSRGDRPLCLTAPNDALNQVRRRFPIEFGKLYPHLMRHTFSANFKIHNLTAKLKDNQARQVQNYLQGWSDTSREADRYGSPANVIIADKYIKDMNAGLEVKARQIAALDKKP